MEVGQPQDVSSTLTLGGEHGRDEGVGTLSKNHGPKIAITNVARNAIRTMRLLS